MSAAAEYQSSVAAEAGPPAEAASGPEEFPLILSVFMVMGAWRISRAGVLTRIGPVDESADAEIAAALAVTLAACSTDQPRRIPRLAVRMLLKIVVIGLLMGKSPLEMLGLLAEVQQQAPGPAGPQGPAGAPPADDETALEAVFEAC